MFQCYTSSPLLLEGTWAVTLKAFTGTHLSFLAFALTQGIPNSVHSTMDSIVALLDRNSNQGRVQQLRAEFEEYLADM